MGSGDREWPRRSTTKVDDGVGGQGEGEPAMGEDGWRQVLEHGGAQRRGGSVELRNGVWPVG